MNRNTTPSIWPIFVGIILLAGVLGLFIYGHPVKVQAQQAVTLSAPATTILSSAFTYQGYLQKAGKPIDNVVCHFKFSLWDAVSSGVQLGTQTINGVSINKGVFTVQVDFGNVFTGKSAWLATAVQCPGDSGYTTLTPRQPITAAPYALSLQPGAIVSSTEPVGLSLIANNAPNQTALYAEANQTDSVAVYGKSENNTAVFGNSGTGRGVWGQSTVGEGVYGYSSDSRGVMGVSGAAGGAGVLGQADGSNAAGVAGYSVNGQGVYGDSTTGTGVYGFSRESYGVRGRSFASGGTGVYGYNNAVSGIGIKGKADSLGGVGVYGSSVNNTAVYGDSTQGKAVWGQSTNNNGVYGTSSADNMAGVYGGNGSTSGIGVWGQANAASGVGVFGSSTANTGVYGQSIDGVGVWGSGHDAGVYGTNGGSNTDGWAGYYFGRVIVNGTLQKAGGSFTIDHPLDPENMYLQHSFVESPDMMNVYNGNISLDEMGEAVIIMPDWFEALNQDFRYQLTAVGAPGPNLYIAETVQNNQFKVAGGTPGMTVSWQITGIRHDPWADTNRIEVELPKIEEEQGLYLHPELYGLSPAEGISAQFEERRPTIDD